MSTPVLRLAVLCQSVVLDGDGRPYSLEVPAHSLGWPPDHSDGYQPTPPLELYAQLEVDTRAVDKVGVFWLWTAVRVPGSERDLFRTKPLEVAYGSTENGRLLLELAVRLNGLRFPRPGEFELHLFANQVSMHEADDQNPFPPLRVTVEPAGGTTGGIL